MSEIVREVVLGLDFSSIQIRVITERRHFSRLVWIDRASDFVDA